MGKELYRSRLQEHDEWRDYWVWWDDLTKEHVDAYQRCLESGSDERDMQVFLEDNPMLLSQFIPASWGRWVIPQKRLGSEYVTDFAVGGMHSFGTEWIVIELESPKARMFTREGDPSKDLTHAIRQIQDWRAWLQVNQNYAARSRQDGGLGMHGIRSDVPGWIFLGRRRDNDSSTDSLRTQMCNDLNIAIHSYDALLDIGRYRLPMAADMRHLGKHPAED